MHALIDDVISYLRSNYLESDTILLDPKCIQAISEIDETSQKAPTPYPTLKITPPLPKRPFQKDIPPKKVEPLEKENPAKTIPELEKQKGPQINFPTSEWKKLYAKIDSSLHVYDIPPTDETAKKARFAYKDIEVLAPILILADATMSKHVKFLNNLAKAISQTFFPCKLLNITEIEKENRWDTIISHESLRFIIAPKSTIFQNPHLLSHYREIQQPLKRIGSIPTLLFESVEQFYAHPEKKKALWKFLTEWIPKQFHD